MKIEIGGGRTARGDGFVNLDQIPEADIVIDLESGVLPFADDSIDEVYSAHCLEHVQNAEKILAEILRVCKAGAPVELRFPHWLHPMASCPGHVHVISDRQVQIWCDATGYPMLSHGKGFELLGIHYQIDVAFAQLRKKFPMLTDEEVAQFIPSCCHEIRCKMKVVSR